MADDDQNEKDEKLAKVKTLTRVVCICKGINLGKVLPALKDSETVADVNRKAGTGNGGCQGQRCGPKIKILLEKYEQTKKKSSEPPKDSPPENQD